MTALVAALPVALLAFLVAAFLVTNKRKFGFWIWEQRRLNRTGIEAKAKVLARVDRGFSSNSGRVTYHLFEVVLEVDPPQGGDRYRTSTTIELMSVDGTTAAEGDVVPVRIDPTRPERVMLALDDIERDRAAARAAKQKSEDERVKALLGK